MHMDKSLLLPQIWTTAGGIDALAHEHDAAWRWPVGCGRVPTLANRDGSPL
jgi:hypothetical protein